MNTQTFAQAQTVTDEELMTATGGFFGKVAGKVAGAAVRNVLPKVTPAGAVRTGAQAIVMTGADLIANGGAGSDE